MENYDDIFNPNKSVESLGQSLLSNAQANARQARRARNPSSSDLLKSVGAQLIGHFTGEYIRSSMENDFQKHINKESELAKRALVKSAVQGSNQYMEIDRLGAQHAGGLRGYLYDDLVARNEAQFKARLGGEAALKSPAHITQISRQLADDVIEQHYKNTLNNIAHAKKVQEATGGDVNLYYNELRKNAAVDDSLLAQLSRRGLALFRDRDDEDYDNALYNGVTSSNIYKVSKEYKDSFDKTYTETGSALSASVVSKYLEQNKDKIRSLALATEIKSLDINGDGNKQDFLIIKGPDGNPYEITDLRSSGLISPESLSKFSTRMSSTQADEYFINTYQSIDTELRTKLDTAMPMPEGASDAVKKANRKNMATAIAQTEEKISSAYEDAGLSETRLRSIATRAVVMDFERNGRADFVKTGKELNDNPFLTWPAIVEEYGGDVDDVPRSVTRVALDRIDTYISNLPDTTTPRRIEELREFANKHDLFDNLEYAQGGSVYDKLTQAKVNADLKVAFKAARLKNPSLTLEEFTRVNERRYTYEDMVPRGIFERVN